MSNRNISLLFLGLSLIMILISSVSTIKASMETEWGNVYFLIRFQDENMEWDEWINVNNETITPKLSQKFQLKVNIETNQTVKVMFYLDIDRNLDYVEEIETFKIIDGVSEFEEWVDTGEMNSGESHLYIWTIQQILNTSDILKTSLYFNLSFQPDSNQNIFKTYGYHILGFENTFDPNNKSESNSDKVDENSISENDETDSDKTPGFEFLILFCAIVLIFLLKRKR